MKKNANTHNPRAWLSLWRTRTLLPNLCPRLHNYIVQVHPNSHPGPRTISQNFPSLPLQRGGCNSKSDWSPRQGKLWTRAGWWRLWPWRHHTYSWRSHWNSEKCSGHPAVNYLFSQLIPRKDWSVEILFTHKYLGTLIKKLCFNHASWQLVSQS